MQVPTVKGSVDTSQMGLTLMHEHMFVVSEGVSQAFPSVWDPDSSAAQTTTLLKEVASLGVQTMVDLTVFGLGRNIALIKSVAEQIPINVIVATGLYTYNELPHYFENRDADHMAQLFIKDIREGIGDGGIKAGILKCATDEPGVTPGVEKVLRAVARAHKETGVPIYTHTHAGTKRGLEQQRIFKEEGVDLTRVVIGHCGDTDDIDYLTQVLDGGSFIGMDRFGLDMILPTDKRVAAIVELIQRGHADRLILSHDYCSYIDWFPPEAIKELAPSWRFTLIFQEVLPALRKSGVTEEQISQMMVDNPRRVFEGR